MFNRRVGAVEMRLSRRFALRTFTLDGEVVIDLLDGSDCRRARITLSAAQAAGLARDLDDAVLKSLAPHSPLDTRSDGSGLDDGVPLPAKSLSDAHAIRQRAWETRRRKYGERGHA